ncbi:MAG TPA: P-loop NTPase [Kofleriaceae bacterium]|nr:P-loop NTPase [Kofleriaceae bacterium]
MIAQRKKPHPRTIAICGGKGGVGKSTVSANLALAIARLGHHVTIVDADLGAANLHTMFGVLHPEHGIADYLDQQVDSLQQVSRQVAVPSLQLVPGTSRPGAANLTRAQKLRLLRGIATLDTECVIVDLGAGTSFNVVDLVAAADLKLFVVTPQLPSLHNAYALLKACVHRVVRKLATDDLGQSMIDSALGQEQKARTVTQLLTALRSLDEPLVDRIHEALGRFGVGLIANLIESEAEVAALARMTPLMLDHLCVKAPLMAAVRRSPSLAGGLRAGARTLVDRNDDSTPAFRLLARTVLDADLATLRGETAAQKPTTLPLWILRDLIDSAEDGAAPPAVVASGER